MKLQKVLACLLILSLVFTLGMAAQAAPKRAVALNGTVEIDGIVDEVWDGADWITDFQYKTGTTDGNVGPLVVKAKVLWDNDYLYLLFDITDPLIQANSSTAWKRDSVEFYIDGNNSKGTTFDKVDDFHYNVPAQEGADKVFIDNANSVQDNNNMHSFVKLTQTGYLVEIASSWKSINAKAGTVIGLDLQCNDDQNGDGERDVCVGWSDQQDKASSNPSVWGELELSAEKADNEQTGETTEGEGGTATTTEQTPSVTTVPTKDDAKATTTRSSGAGTGEAAPLAAALTVVLATAATLALRKRTR